jgi:uncharacterized protein YggE
MWSLAVAALLASSAHAATIPDYPFVYVTGEAQESIPPDIADATFTVMVEGPDAAIAERAVQSRVADVLDVLHAAGMSTDQIDASGLAKEAVTTDESEKGPVVIRGYRVSRQFSLRIIDLRGWPRVASHLLESPNISELQVTFGRSDSKSIEATLVDKAAQDAQEKAQRLAKSFGRHAGVVMALSQSQFADMGPIFGMGPEEGVAPAPEAVMVSGQLHDSSLFVPRTIQLSIEVHAVVKLQ